jgi:hypothetical protein
MKMHSTNVIKMQSGRNVQHACYRKKLIIKALELEPQVQIFEMDNIKKKSTMPMAHLPIC